MKTTMLDQIGFWDVTELITLNECEAIALQGVDIRVDNGRVYLPVFDKSETRMQEW